MLKALIFDFDGLILDTETPEYHAINEAYRELGQNLPVTTYGQVVGSQYSQAYEPVSHLQQLTGKPLDAEAFWKKVNIRRMALINQASVQPGVESLIREAQTHGLKLAIASSSPHQWVEGHLQRFNLLRYFDVIKCSEDVRRVKPEPDLFLAALQALHVQADEAVIFEDSLNGVVAARRAGIRVVLVPNPVTEHLTIEGETLRFQSLADVSLDSLIKKL